MLEISKFENSGIVTIVWMGGKRSFGISGVGWKERIEVCFPEIENNPLSMSDFSSSSEESEKSGWVFL